MKRFKKTHKVTAAILCAVMMLGTLVPVMSIGTDAADKSSGVYVFDSVDSKMLGGVLDRPTELFDSSELSWKISARTATSGTYGASGTSGRGYKIECGDGAELSSFDVFDGSGSLVGIFGGGTRSATVARTFSGSLDYTGVRYLAFAVWVSRDSADTASVTLKLGFSSGRTAAFPATVDGGKWSVVMVDLSDVSSKLSITSVSLTVARSSSAGSFDFAFDCIGGCTDDNAVFAMKYTAPSYYAGGAGMGEKDGNFLLTLSGSDPYIETGSLKYNDFTGGKGIRVRFRNRTNCRRVTMYRSSAESSEFTGERSASFEIAPSDDLVTLVFPVSENYVGKFRIVFEGNVKGEIEIEEIVPVSYHSSELTPGDVRECKISSNLRDVTLSCTISASSLAKYRGSALYLFETDMYVDSETVIRGRYDGTISPVKRVTLSSTDFTVSYTPSNINATLFKKYFLMIESDGTLTPFDNEKYVTNPERLSRISCEYPSISGKKGSYNPDGTFPQNGSSVSAIRVDLSELISLSPSEYSFVSDSQTYFFDASAVKKLDEMNLYCYAYSAYFNAILTASPSDDDVKNRILLGDNSTTKAPYGAIDTKNADGVRYLRAAVEFLSERYAYGADRGRLVGFVVGRNVDDAARNYDMGGATLSEFAYEYAAAIRIVYNAAKSVSTAPRVYASLGSTWNRGIGCDERHIYDSESLLGVLAAVFADLGDIEWQLAFDPYPDDAAYLAFAQNPDVTDNPETKLVTAANIEVLVEYMTRPGLYFGGEYRHIILLETSRPELSESAKRKAAADYVYTYLKIGATNFSIVDSLIIARDVDVDGAVSLIDTDRRDEVIAFADKVLAEEKAPSMDRLLPLLSTTLPEKRTIYAASLGSELPLELSGRAALLNFGEESTELFALRGCSSLKSASSFDGRDDLLYVLTENVTDYAAMCDVFGYTLDLSRAPYISFDAKIAVLPDGMKNAKIRLTLYSGTSSASFDGTVSAGEWSTFAADVSGFDKLKSVTALEIRVMSEDGKPLGSPTLLLSNVNISSASLSDSEIQKLIRDARTGTGKSSRVGTNIKLVVILCTVIVAAAVCEIVNVRHRRKRALRAADDDFGFPGIGGGD